ncbi:replication protein A 70 kDa DNA-binding subunit [Tribolium castaneum]|uniref:Replication protein A subunit n=1 Tax=Tribolium castaneum TaxID=7070 RepID=D7EJW6_TRICA|nr:PREDICTED: replication protein A 70 kDa DNA-binding subunit [Tribolium castaneum]EFA12891.1 Replication protein A 70 kDa DNA-binding subunit-like Protein [Tribolium castaneum]|eukprot:XP_970093.1 PREDICTED: replication protein A 70 kDa DNA-binding subunit [Tribolium castaneum]
MKDKLTAGALLRIMKGQEVEEPLVQVLVSKKISSRSAETERYRIWASDGDYSITYGILTLPPGKPVEDFSIIKLKKFVKSEISNAKGPQKILLIIDSEIVTPGHQIGVKIGEPVTLTDEIIASETSSTPKVSTSEPPVKQPKSEQSTSLNQSISETRVLNQINALTPYHNKWVIKARVTNKSDMRTWSNSRGEGKLFSFDLMDDSGEIRCTAFRDMADKYFNYLQVDKVYYISKCQLKAANKQFNTLKNEYEMTIGNETIIEECLTDDGHVPQVKYNFVPISALAEKEVGNLVDVIGICKEASEVQTFTSKSTNRELRKREITLVDQSKTSIALTLWGSQADSFDATNNPVVVIKGAKVGEFGGGKNLSTLMSSQIKLNPDIPECHRIKGWYDSEGQYDAMTNLSERVGGVGSFQTAWMSLKEVQDKGLGHSEKGDYFQVKATILLVRSENALYKACPTDDCNKKVVDLENGMYRCEKCCREFPNFKYRLLVSMNIGDFSGNQWVSVFSSEAEKILGKTAQEIGLTMRDDSEAGTAIFQAANFKQFIFKCRAKMENYNDEQRLKIVVVKVDPVNYEEYNGYLCEQIEALMV